MELTAAAIVCAVRAHGENGAIVRVMTAEHGLLAGYVNGGRSRRMRAILVPGNAVAASLRARTTDQLPRMTVELEQSRAALIVEPLAAAALEWATLLTAQALPEGQGYPAVYHALDAVLQAVALAPSARGWAGAMVRFELVVLQALGFGLSLDACVVTGAAQDLRYVSPKSAGAVSAAAAAGYERQLLPLPPFLRDGSAPSLDDVLDGLRLSGHFVAQKLFDDSRNDPMIVRQRMVDRLSRASA